MKWRFIPRFFAGIPPINTFFLEVSGPLGSPINDNGKSWGT
jgi:hypothetical protein